MLIFDNSRPVSYQNLQKVNRNNICWWCPTTHMCWCPPTTSCGGVHPPHHVVVSTHPHVLVSTHHIMWWRATSHMCWCSPTTSCGGVRPAICAGAMKLSPWGVKQIFHHPYLGFIIICRSISSDDFRSVMVHGGTIFLLFLTVIALQDPNNPQV